MAKLKFPKEILEKAKTITGRRARVVVDHLLQHGTISTEDLRSRGYTHPLGAIRDVRDQGLPLVMFWTRDSAGRRIGAYRFGDVAAIRSSCGAVTFKCSWCSHRLETTEDRRGKRMTCPRCKTRNYVPVIRPRRENLPGMWRPKKPPRRKVEQAVEIHVRLARAFDAGPADEEEGLLPLGRPLTEAIEGARLGKVWSEDYGGQKLIITLLGPSADAMFDAIDPLLRGLPAMQRRGSRVVKLYDYSDPGCKKSVIRYS